MPARRFQYRRIGGHRSADATIEEKQGQDSAEHVAAQQACFTRTEAAVCTGHISTEARAHRWVISSYRGKCVPR